MLELLHHTITHIYEIYRVLAKIIGTDRFSAVFRVMAICISVRSLQWCSQIWSFQFSEMEIY
jgi:hypothetical protein